MNLTNEEIIGLDRLEARLDYDPLNGTLTWKRIPDGEPDPSGFNKRCAGKIIKSRRNGYVSVQIDKKQLYGHRVAFYLYHGWLPSQVDHEDRVRDNIKIGNLRPASHAENMRNRGVGSLSATGIKNIGITSKGYYRVSIRCENSRIENQFKELDDAIEWRDIKLKELHKEFANS